MNGGDQGTRSNQGALSTYRELSYVKEYFLLSRPAIVLLLQTRPRAEKDGGGWYCFIGWSVAGGNARRLLAAAAQLKRGLSGRA